MYVCVCQAISDQDIRRAIAEGASSFEELQACTGCTTCCGCCEQEARRILASQLESGFRATELSAAA